TIIFIDELHTLVGAGAQAGSLDAANLLKPALARGEIQCIGATTLDEYRQVIEKDGALERRFQKILVEQTDYAQTLEILEALKPKYEKHHNVAYTPEAIKACVTLSSRYITDRSQPDKAIDVMDEAGARTNAGLDSMPAENPLAEQLEAVRAKKRDAAAAGDFKAAAELKEQEEALVKTSDEAAAQLTSSGPKTLGEEDIAQVVSMMTNIPVHRVSATEGERLLTMASNLKKQIIGQDDAVEAVVKAIQRNRAGLRDPNKPVGSFIFLGPTGVGKTYLAKKLAEYMFDSEDNLIRIDMSEYMERYSVSSLIGAPPGYVGYDQGGQLSEQVRRKPYSVVLFDEIEKAHQDIFNLLLQVLDEGRLTDAAGRHIDFKNTILIMTSNIGSKQASELGAGIGYKTATDDAPHRKNVIIEKALRRKFSPEFLNRIDDRILFNSLTKEDVEQILEIELKKFRSRIAQMGFDIKVSKETKEKILAEGYDPEFGARPLGRAIQKYLEDPVAEKIIAGEKPSKC
ncbi:MAG: ATP-dependent Clp protease ATP-binding subunit, partial [Bacteroidales bacterium]|nr:ATP-dependent Clp protease ATP-binding subunit [Bacteroidales bacterium]